PQRRKIRARPAPVREAADRPGHSLQLAVARSFPRGHAASRGRPGTGDRSHWQLPQVLSPVSMDLQIDDFHKDVAAGLLRIYQAFPRKITINIEAMVGRDEPDDIGLPSKRHQSCLAALMWLAEEGYLRFESTIQFQAIDQAVLTENAFLRLTRSVPEAALA